MPIGYQTHQRQIHDHGHNNTFSKAKNNNPIVPSATDVKAYELRMDANVMDDWSIPEKTGQYDQRYSSVSVVNA